MLLWWWWWWWRGWWFILFHFFFVHFWRIPVLKLSRLLDAAPHLVIKLQNNSNKTNIIISFSTYLQLVFNFGQPLPFASRTCLFVLFYYVSSPRSPPPYVWRGRLMIESPASSSLHKTLTDEEETTEDGNHCAWRSCTHSVPDKDVRVTFRAVWLLLGYVAYCTDGGTVHAWCACTRGSEMFDKKPVSARNRRQQLCDCLS